MRPFVAIALVIAKLIAALNLLILILGYLFFLNSHDARALTYIGVTALALVLALFASPFRPWTKFKLTFFGAVSLLAVLVGIMEIDSHLNFFEGPNYRAAGYCGLSIAAVLTSFSCSYYLSRYASDDVES
jgi:hypothetical protein